MVTMVIYLHRDYQKNYQYQLEKTKYQSLDNVLIRRRTRQEFGVLTCFVEGRQNLYFSNLTEEEQQDLMRQFLRLTFQDLEMEYGAIIALGARLLRDVQLV